MDVVIRADGSHDLGYGHLIRSGTVAREFLDRGHDVSYATRTVPQVEDVCPQDVSVLPARESPGDWLRDTDPDIVVTDSHELTTSEYQRIRKSVPTLAAIVDDSRTAVSADVLVNSNIYADEISYEWRPPEPTWCLGLDYLLLRESFRSLASRSPPWRKQPAEALVIMGGVDKENRTPAAMRAFAGFDIDLTVVIGPGYTNETAVREAAEATPTNVAVVEDPPNLPALMFDADFAVCTLGTIVYELMATQTPIIGIPDNDTPIDTVLADRGLALVLDRETDADEIEAAIGTLCTDPERRRRLWQAGDDLVTGDGPSNVADVIENVTA